MTPTAPELAVQTVAYAGLDALLAVHPFDLCAYLHVGEQLGPQLYMRRPTLASLDPAVAFRLFSALRDQLDAAGGDDRRTSIEGFDARLVPSSGPHSRGLLVTGMRLDSGESADEPAAESTATLAHAVMQVCHLAETALVRHAPAAVRHVTVETRDGATHATVTIEHEGVARVGHAEAAAAPTAVASATLEALDPSLKVMAAGEDGIGTERAVLVLVEDAAGRSAVGASLIGADAMSAAATAALDAAAALH